jgi:PKD repeat protein
MTLSGADPSCSSSTFTTISLNLASVQDVEDNLCPSAKNHCNNMGCVTPGTVTPAIEKYIFKGFVNVGPTSGIPASCCNVRLSWELCCRNGIIATGSANANFYTQIIFNRCLGVSPCNNTPVAFNDPLFIIPGGNNVQFNLGMYDAENDSISYSFTPSLEGYNSSVSYTPPFSYDRPLPWTGAWNAPFPAGISVDPKSGVVRFTPTNASGSNFAGVLAVEAKEWRNINGVPTVISISRRDAQCIILASTPPNNLPRIKTIPSLAGDTVKQHWTVCPGEQLCFTVMGTDTDAMDSARLFFNLPPQMSTATITQLATGSKRDSARFCWTPQDADASKIPYAMNVRVRDMVCPIDGKSHYSFTIRVLQRQVLNTISKTTAGCNRWNLGYSLKTGAAAPQRTKWRISKTPGDYTLTSADSFTNVPTITNRQFTQPGKYLVQLSAWADTTAGCTDILYDTITVSMSTLSVSANDTSTCKNSSVMLNATASNHSGPVLYIWTNPGSSVVLGTTSTYAASVITTSRKIVVKVTDSLSCTAYDTVSVSVNGSPSLSYHSLSGSSICQSDNPFRFINTSADTSAPGTTYRWKLGNTDLGTADTLTHTITTPGNYTFKLLSLTPAGCADSVTIASTVNASPVADFTISNDSQCLNTASFTFTNTSSVTPAGALTYLWTFGNNNSSNAANPPVQPYSAAGTYTVQLITSVASGCADTNTKQVTVHPVPAPDFILNQASQCITGNLFVATNTTPGSSDPQYTFTWKNGTDVSSAAVYSKSFTTTGTGSIQLNLVTSHGCKDSVSRSIAVLPDAIAAFTVNDSLQCLRGNHFVFTSTSPSPGTITWNIDGQLYTGAVVQVTFATGGTKNIRQIVASSDGCRDSLEKTVSFYPSPAVALTVDNNSKCLGESFTFTHTNSITPPATIVSGWAFSDSIYSSANPYTRTFATPGVYIAHTGALSSDGCADSASIIITVTLKPAPVTVSGPLIASYTTAHTYMTASLLGASYSWFIENGTINSGNGTNTINVHWDSTKTEGLLHVVVTNASGCPGDTASAAVIITPPVGIDELESFSNISIFPNPASDELSVRLKTSRDQYISLTLTTLLGKEVISTAPQMTSGAFDQQLRISDLPRGMYLLTIRGEYSGSVIKVVLN